MVSARLWGLSVLSVEPYGMKPNHPMTDFAYDDAFSALGRAVWDETISSASWPRLLASLSVLSVEPYGMKHDQTTIVQIDSQPFSALGRAVWDETMVTRSEECCIRSFSALGRAVWDETGWKEFTCKR